MHALVEISKYPLSKDYDAPILDFISRLKSRGELDISVGETSTVIRGEYRVLMEILTKEMEVSLDGDTRTVFVLKVLNLK